MKAPPLLVSFASLDQYLKAITEDLRLVHQQDITSLVAKNLPPVVSFRCLAVLFGYSPKFLGVLSKRTEDYYRTFSIPKGKGKRFIQAPRVSLKVIQKWFGEHLSEALTFDEHVFGFVKNRSAVQGASVHCQAKWTYSVDIKDFFSSTPKEKIVECLVGLGYPNHGAELIGKLCSYNGFLAQGSPASPVLSNLVFKQEDLQLKILAADHVLRYTRYADDIVFSGKGVFPEGLPKAVHSILRSQGWTISKKKEKFTALPNRLKVYGLLVYGDYPKLTKGYRNKLRAFRHLLNDNKIAPQDIPRIQGHLAYEKSVDGMNRIGQE